MSNTRPHIRPRHLRATRPPVTAGKAYNISAVCRLLGNGDKPFPRMTLYRYIRSGVVKRAVPQDNGFVMYFGEDIIECWLRLRDIISPLSAIDNKVI